MFGSRNFLFAKSAAAAPVIGGKLFMWGSNNFGQLGLGNSGSGTNRSSPVQVGSLTDWAYVTTTNSTLCTKTNSTLWSWGFNTYGTLGLGNTANSSSPVQVGALTNWKTPILAGYASSFCIKTDGTLWSWGRNNFGQLGFSNTTNYSSPKQIGSSTNWVSITGENGYSIFAVDGTGKLFSWGRNTYGVLGQGDTTNRSSPTQVGALTTWAKPSTGKDFVLCTKTDGTLWAWGRNYFGTLGLGNRTHYSSPKQVGSLTNWATPGCSNQSSTCIKTDGTLWTWGYNYAGGLGLGNTTNYSSPKQVGALTNWAIPGAGNYATVCLKTDGTLWTWGNNSSGKLGLGDTANRSSPVQIGSIATWINKPSIFVATGCIQT